LLVARGAVPCAGSGSRL
jgi:hypothetical protein